MADTIWFRGVKHRKALSHHRNQFAAAHPSSWNRFAIPYDSITINGIYELCPTPKCYRERKGANVTMRSHSSGLLAEIRRVVFNEVDIFQVSAFLASIFSAVGFSGQNTRWKTSSKRSQQPHDKRNKAILNWSYDRTCNVSTSVSIVTFHILWRRCM